MPTNPWYTTQLTPLWTQPLTGANLTGISANQISIVLKNMSNSVETTGTGVIAITQANPGIITYQPSAADVANAGMFHAWAWVTFANGPEPFDLGIWDIAPK